MKKIYKLGAKTGLTKAEVRRVFEFGLLGMLAVGFSSLTGCLRLQRSEPPGSGVRPRTLQNYSGSRSVPKAELPGPDAPNGGTVDNVSAPAGPTPDATDGCGPYPGYPCGTRYYTVSRADFGFGIN